MEASQAGTGPDGRTDGAAASVPAEAAPNLDRESPNNTTIRRPGSIAAPVGVFLISRIVLGLLGRFAPNLIPSIGTNPSVLPRSDPLAHAWTWFSPWFRFDAWWYVDVAQHGYHWGRIPDTNTNFFPLFPVLIRALHVVTLGSYWIAALAVANISFLIALIVLWEWAVTKWDSETATRVLLLVTFFPFSFFYASPYAEPLFLALAVAAFAAAERGRWTLAGICAGLSAVTRPVGFAVIAALILWSCTERRWTRAASLVASTIPFGLYVAFLGITTGHPLAFSVYHTNGWVAPRGGLLHSIAIQFNTGLSPFDRVDVAVSILFALSAVFVWRSLGAPYALYVVLGLASPLSRSLAGMERYVIVLFPVMAVWARARAHFVQLTVFAVSLFMLVVATSLFASGYSLF